MRSRHIHDCHDIWFVAHDMSVTTYVCHDIYYVDHDTYHAHHDIWLVIVVTTPRHDICFTTYASRHMDLSSRHIHMSWRTLQNHVTTYRHDIWICRDDRVICRDDMSWRAYVVTTGGYVVTTPRFADVARIWFTCIWSKYTYMMIIYEHVDIWSHIWSLFPLRFEM